MSDKIIERNEYYRRRKYKDRYGITYEDFIKMCDEQEAKCLICFREVKLHLDHCHDTGKIRGALCHQCNNGLGCFRDDPELLKKALEYLK